METLAVDAPVRTLAVAALTPSRFSLATYGDPAAEVADLIDSVRSQGILVPLVVAPLGDADRWEVVSGHRRLACATKLGLTAVPCQVRDLPRGAARRLAVLDYNRQRRKTFSQMMREADALADLYARQAARRKTAALRQFQDGLTDRRNSDDRPGRSDERIARRIGLGGKDLYRQARAVWTFAAEGDPRAKAAVLGIDAGTKSIHAAYKDLRRRDRFAAGFRPTPYDVWAFRHDPAFGVPHPGSIPPAIVAHTLHYFTEPDALVVDPMAGGGTTLDVCRAMGRRCLASDLAPVRDDIAPLDVRNGLPTEASGSDLIFCDPPYHTMLARRWQEEGNGIAESSLSAWINFLGDLSVRCYVSLRPGGYIALLLANQTEKDVPPGLGYLDHVFHGYSALVAAGFQPQRRISCPMQGAYLPQHVRRARTDGRLLGQVRDLLVMRKPW